MFLRRLDPSPAAKAGRRFAGLAAASLLAVLALALGAAPAIAAAPQTASIQTLTAGYAAVTVKGTVDPGDENSTWWAETSLDNVHWSGNPGPFGALAAHSGPRTVEATVTDEEGKPAKFLLGATRYYVRLVVSNGTLLTYSSPPNPFVTTLPVTPPKVLATDNAAGVTYTTAKVSGSVERPANTDPAFNANCAFEYVIQSQFVLTGFKEAAKTPCNVNPVTAPGANPVSAELTGLKPGGTYHLRLTASNPGGSSSLAAAATFTTTAISPPSVTISPATLGIGTAAHFSGTINPQLGPGGNSLYEVKWHFECTPKCLGPNGEPLGGTPIPPDNSSHPVSADVVLEPNTEYHVTLVATNAGATATSSPVTLTTPPFLPIARTLGVSVGAGLGEPGREDQPAERPGHLPVRMGPDRKLRKPRPGDPAVASPAPTTPTTSSSRRSAVSARPPPTTTGSSPPTPRPPKKPSVPIAPSRPCRPPSRRRPAPTKSRGSAPRPPCPTAASSNSPRRASPARPPPRAGPGSRSKGSAKTAPRSPSSPPTPPTKPKAAPRSTTPSSPSWAPRAGARGASRRRRRRARAPTSAAPARPSASPRSHPVGALEQPAAGRGRLALRHQPLPAPGRRHAHPTDHGRRPPVRRRRRAHRRLEGLQPALHRLHRQTAAGRSGQRRQRL